MNQKGLTNDSNAIIYCGKNIDAKIASAISYRIIENYYGVIIINFVDNGFEKEIPSDLWNYRHLVMIGVSPNEIGMRTIRSMIHDNNIVWIDNQIRNIPMWTEYYMLPGDLNPEKTLTELAWKYYHDDEQTPEVIKLMTDDIPVIEMAKML